MLECASRSVMIVYSCLNDCNKIPKECIGLEITRDFIKCRQEVIVLEIRLSGTIDRALDLIKVLVGDIE